MIISGKHVGEGHPCFIIGEAGSNHNRDINLAYELIHAAKEAGLDAVKFQLCKAEKHYSRKTPPFEYLTKQGFSQNIVDLVKAIELPRGWVEKLRDYAAKLGIMFFCTVTSREDVDLAEKLELPLYKLPSFEIVDLSLIEYTASKGKPFIISTGLASLSEIEDAYLSVMKTGNNNLIFLQCASVYPASYSIMNLRSMSTIRQAFQVVVGLSDHTEGIHIAPAAVAIGAKVIEKHFTMNRSLPGPDHSFAVEPVELKKMVQYIRDVEAALGNGLKTGPSAQEAEMYEKARRSLHAASRIPKGTIIESSMLTVKRPGYGIKPKFSNLLIGRKAKRDIDADEWITWEMI